MNAKDFTVRKADGTSMKLADIDGPILAVNVASKCGLTPQYEGLEALNREYAGRGLTILGTGMHHDPLISSRKRVHVSWGHDWVILSLLVPNPPWSPTKVWALPVGLRLYKNRQGLTKGKGARSKGKAGKRRPPDPTHRTRIGNRRGAPRDGRATPNDLVRVASRESRGDDQRHG